MIFTNIYRRFDLPILIGLYLFALPFRNLIWYPLFVMSVTGISLFISYFRKGIFDESVKWLFYLAACLWIPGIISLVDSVSFSRTLQYVVTLPLFAFVGVFVAIRLRTHAKTEDVATVIISITVFWLLTVLWQVLLPAQNPFGVGGSHNQGIHSATANGGLMLGVILGSMFPFIVYYFFHRKNYLIAVISAFVLLAAIMLSGTRSAWLSAFTSIIVTIFIFLFRVRPSIKQTLIVFFGTVFIALFGLKTLSIYSPALEQRIAYSLAFFNEPSFKSFEYSSSGRGSIWRDAFNMGVDNPVNGIGANSFRIAHPNYMQSDSEKFKYDWPQTDGSTLLIGASHPHQIILDAFSSTGFIGLIGLIILFVLVLKQTWLAITGTSILFIGVALSFWGVFSPLNTHNNLFGGWVMGWMWLWLGLLAGVSSSFNRR